MSVVTVTNGIIGVYLLKTCAQKKMIRKKSIANMMRMAAIERFNLLAGRHFVRKNKNSNKPSMKQQPHQTTTTTTTTTTSPPNSNRHRQHRHLQHQHSGRLEAVLLKHGRVVDDNNNNNNNDRMVSVATSCNEDDMFDIDSLDGGTPAIGQRRRPNSAYKLVRREHLVVHRPSPTIPPPPPSAAAAGVESGHLHKFQSFDDEEQDNNGGGGGDDDSDEGDEGGVEYGGTLADDGTGSAPLVLDMPSSNGQQQQQAFSSNRRRRFVPPSPANITERRLHTVTAYLDNAVFLVTMSLSVSVPFYMFAILPPSRSQYLTSHSS